MEGSHILHTVNGFDAKVFLELFAVGQDDCVKIELGGAINDGLQIFVFHFADY